MTQSPPTGELVARLRERTFSKWSSDIQAVEDFTDELATEAADALTTLERELEEARARLTASELERGKMATTAVRHAIASQAEVERLKAALKPFADTADEIHETVPDRDEMWENPASMSVTAGDFRRARAALQVEESKT